MQNTNIVKVSEGKGLFMQKMASLCVFTAIVVQQSVFSLAKRPVPVKTQNVKTHKDRSPSAPSLGYEIFANNLFSLDKNA